MNAEQWRRTIGPQLFNHIVQVASEGDNTPIEERVAAALSHATEMGFTAPVHPPRVSKRGTATLWPGGEQVLTTTGLLDYYDSRGHKFYLLRVPQMLRGHRGPLAARLQETLALYEAQCEVEGVEPLPDYADCDLFVGGGKKPARRDLADQLLNDSNGE